MASASMVVSVSTRMQSWQCFSSASRCTGAGFAHRQHEVVQRDRYAVGNAAGNDRLHTLK
jgi:hypothetical protein